MWRAGQVRRGEEGARSPTLPARREEQRGANRMLDCRVSSSTIAEPGRDSEVSERPTESGGDSNGQWVSPLADEEAAELLTQLRRAVAQVCPYRQSAERDDVVQAAIVRILELRGRNPERRDLSFPYLRRVAYSAFIDDVRREQRRPETPMKPESEDQIAASNPCPERLSTGHEIGGGIRSCLAALIRPRRLAVTLHLQGHTVPEIGGILGWTTKRAENLVYRGMADLRQCLSKSGVSA